MYVGRFPAAPQQLRAAESDLCPAGLEEQPPERSPDSVILGCGVMCNQCHTHHRPSPPKAAQKTFPRRKMGNPLVRENDISEKARAWVAGKQGPRFMGDAGSSVCRGHVAALTLGRGVSNPGSDHGEAGAAH